MNARGRRKSYDIEKSPLFGIKGTRQLAAALKCEVGSLAGLRSAGQRYRIKHRETKPGKIREIEDPPHDLKVVQARISKLLMRVTPPEFLYCPVKKRGAIQCTKEHFGADQIWCADIKEYFPSTPREFVFRFFRNRLECAGDVAGILADLTCFDGHLPTGAPSSPILAYFAHEATWLEVGAACDEFDCRTTLWIDDLVVSGAKVPASLQWRIKAALRRGGLRYHKEQFTHAGGLVVTGNLVSNKAFALPHAHYRGVRQLHREIRQAPAEDRPGLRLRLKGKLEHAKTFRRERAELFEI